MHQYHWAMGNMASLNTGGGESAKTPYLIQNAVTSHSRWSKYRRSSPNNARY